MNPNFPRILSVSLIWHAGPKSARLGSLHCIVLKKILYNSIIKMRQSKLLCHIFENAVNAVNAIKYINEDDIYKGIFMIINFPA